MALGKSEVLLLKQKTCLLTLTHRIRNKLLFYVFHDYNIFYLLTMITISFNENFQVLDGLSFFVNVYLRNYNIILYILHLTRGTLEDVQRTAHSTVHSQLGFSVLYCKAITMITMQ